MRAIEVTISSATAEGRLYPRFDVESEILSLESKGSRTWQYGVDVDGRLLFDLDETRRVANCDLLVPRSLWKRTDDVAWPGPTQTGDISFTRATVLQKSFSIPLAVATDRDRRIVRVDIGIEAPDQYVTMSDECVALLSGGRLAGFMGRL